MRSEPAFTTRGPRYPPPIILPIVRADIHDIVRLSNNVGRTSLFRIVNILRGRGPQDGNGKFLTELLNAHFDNPELSGLVPMKAVDSDTKQLTAIALWQRHNYSSTDLRASYSSVGRVSWNLQGNFNLNYRFILDKIQSLEEADNDELAEYMKNGFNTFFQTWTQDVQHIELGSLMTDPRFERRGIGTAMLNWGHKLADSECVPLFLVASPIGHPLYQRVGWKDIHSPLEVDFGNWVPYAETGDKGWGVFKFYFMLRLPKTLL